MNVPEAMLFIAVIAEFIIFTFVLIVMNEKSANRIAAIANKNTKT
jgi:hypothetical protein